MVPMRIASYVQDASPNCFRRCGQEGLGCYIKWACPKVKRFWIPVYKCIYSVTQMNLKKSCWQVLLNQCIEEAPRHANKLISFIFPTARITIAKSWKSLSVSFALHAKLAWIMVDEKQTAILNDKLHLFEKNKKSMDALHFRWTIIDSKCWTSVHLLPLCILPQACISLLHSSLLPTLS